MATIDLSRVPEYYHKYINLAIDDDLDTALQKHPTNLNSVLQDIPAEKWNFRYAESKWSVKEMIQHIIDGERIFCYRALCFARKDDTPLPGFDEKNYATASNADKRNSKDILEELATVQKSSVQLFASFNEEQLNQAGIANGKPVYVKAIGYILVGHALHHRNILLERYLK